MANGKQPPGPEALRDQILAYTKVDVNPKNPKPGERMTVETIPGILPFVTPDLAGKLNLPTGPLDVTLNSLIQIVQFSVKYKITVNGEDMNPQPEFESQTAANLPDSDPLLAWFRLLPPLIPEHAAHAPLKVELVATVKVAVEDSLGVKATEQEIKVPLDLVPIPIPCLLVLFGNSKVFVMVRAGSLITDVTLAANLINTTVQTLNSVKDLLSWGPAFDLFLGDLGDTLSLLSKGGPVGVAVEEAMDLDDFNDFDDEADEMALFGPVGTEVRFYSGEEFNELDGGENEVTAIRLKSDIGASSGVSTGFGFVRETAWQSTRGWDTDAGDEMNDVESCRFFDPGDPLHPGDEDLP